jgi:E3 ubiquitin-protein ligase UBR7
MVEVDDETTTLQEYLNEIDAQEKEAEEVLGLDCSTCFYPQGYIKQKVYACITCAAETGVLCGVCYSCFVTCHTDHEMHELFYRRNFRCDCGTERTTTPCSLNVGKQVRPLNDLNKYGDNFKGINCYCKAYYDDTIEQDVMFQCLVCEDWFHEKCIKTIDQEFDDMICKYCVSKLDFFGYYTKSQILAPIEEAVDIEADTEPSNTIESNSNDICKIKNSKSSLLDGELYLIGDWKNLLCKCESCLKMYAECKVSFIWQVEEAIDPAPDTTKKDKDTLLMEALMKMHRATALDGIREFQNLKSDLLDFMADVSKKRDIVNKEDIENFFSERLNKRRKI